MSVPAEVIEKAKKDIEASTKSALVFPEDLRAAPYYMIFTPIKYSKTSTLGDISLDQVVNTEEDRQFDVNSFGDIFSGQRRGSSPRTPSISHSFESGQLIALPLPSQLNDNLSISFSATDLGLTAAGFQAGQAIGNGTAGLDSTIDTVAYAARVMSQLSEGVNTALNLLAGNVPNPYSVLTFKNVEQRSFDFDWIFVPRNQKESLMIREIINTIRYLALPDQNSLFLEFPYEWEIQFVGTTFLHSFSRGYITDLKVEYGSSGGISFFPQPDGDGAPSQVKFSFSFKEIYPLNKTLITADNKSMYPESNFIENLNLKERAIESLDTRVITIPEQQAESINRAAKKANEAVGYVPKVGGFT
jgi:hypothetical protein